MVEQFAFVFLGASLGLGLAFLLVLVAIFVFEVAMFISVIRNRQISDDRKILWVIGMLLIHPIVAIVYYFTDYQKSGRL